MLNMKEDARPAVFLWRKVDSPGHDSCRFFSLANGYRLLGVGVFLEAGQVCHLSYDVMADAGFRTTRAAVTGFVGTRPVNVRIQARGRHWQVDGKSVPALAGCLDVDLGFTPATNLLPLRRLALHVGQAADAPAAWLAFPAMQFMLLPQHYKRLSGAAYDYQAPGYRGTLQVSPIGAVEQYPGLFELLRCE